MLFPATGKTRSRLEAAKTTYAGRHPPPAASDAPTTRGPIDAPTPYPAWSRPMSRPSRRSATAALNPVSIPPAPSPHSALPVRTTGQTGARAINASPAADDRVARTTRPSRPHRFAIRPTFMAMTR
jgi:hypothetical protein